MPVSTEHYENEISDGRNTRAVKCSYCQSAILSPAAGTFMRNEFHLPLMKQIKTSELNPEKELISSFWLVPDMYTFQNVGFSNTVGTTKFLVCADCEAGPIGYHDLQNGKSYIALSRVRHC
ncbi:hypothetical protein WA026_019065 [Henosepilachna vigintioctopunctata]|uniref:Guanine nucleotide exchange factor MSS4 homolog n=1 Tax=Henosepilachna vigintioctopunctata TaxID=420089 RepID=A0AAW1VA65_9CUCU